MIVPNAPDHKLAELAEDPLLRELRYDPSEIMRGLVSCTGMDYCHFALIETKGWALKTARSLEAKLGKTQPLRMHWSGCPAGCGNHSAAETGLLGKNIKLKGDVVVLVNAVDTIVILMGLGNIRAIMERLQEAGCDPEMPVALIQAGTHASQRKLEVTVRSAADGAWRERFRTPNVIVVGEVVNLAGAWIGFQNQR